MEIAIQATLLVAAYGLSKVEWTQLKTTVALQFAVTMLELFSWTPGPFFSHAFELVWFCGRNKMCPNYLLYSSVFSVPHIFAAIAIARNWGSMIVLYVVYLLGCMVWEIYSWWLGYIFQKGFWYDYDFIDEFEDFHKHDFRILPKIHGAEQVVVPNIEHTLLLFLLAFILIGTLNVQEQRLSRKVVTKNK